MARNTVNNKLTTSKHYKTSKSTHQRVSVEYNHPTPQPLTAGPQTTHQQIGQGLGYTPMLALTEPPLGFESLAWPGFTDHIGYRFEIQVIHIDSQVSS